MLILKKIHYNYFNKYFLNIFILLYYILKFYRTICLTTIILSFFLIINPYRYPYYLFKEISSPFFLICSTLFYPIKFKFLLIKTTDIIGLICLHYLSLFCLFIQNKIKNI